MNKFSIFLVIVLLCSCAYADGNMQAVDPGSNTASDKILPPQVIPEGPSSTIVADHIQKLLEHMGYPENTRDAIEKELVIFLRKIDFIHLKKEASLAKSDPEQLKAFVTKLGALIEQEGYITEHPPHPLVKLLTTSFVNDDISQVIFTSPTSFLQKINSNKSLAACTAISQLGSIILGLLDINVKVAFSPAHVFNCIPLDEQKVLFVDFSNQIFEIVGINQYYYNLASRTMMLKDQYHISSARLREINGQLNSELRADSLLDILNFLYLYIYISDDNATTPGIFINLGNIYSQKGNYDQAILFYNKAIDLDPDYAEAYRQRGIVYGNKGNLNQAITDLNKAIELFADFADAYHDLGSIYSAQGDMDKAIYNFTQAIIINPNYVEAYHDRGIAYVSKGANDQAIADYNKAIDIDPYFFEAYQSRAEAYFSKQEYDKSWKDIHKIQDLGEEVNPDFLDKLKKASELRTIFPFLLAVPVFILLIFRIF